MCFVVSRRRIIVRANVRIIVRTAQMRRMGIDFRSFIMTYILYVIRYTNPAFRGGARIDPGGGTEAWHVHFAFYG
jgi:hypothetical protein